MPAAPGHVLEADRDGRRRRGRRGSRDGAHERDAPRPRAALIVGIAGFLTRSRLRQRERLRVALVARLQGDGLLERLDGALPLVERQIDLAQHVEGLRVQGVDERRLDERVPRARQVVLLREDAASHVQGVRPIGVVLEGEVHRLPRHVVVAGRVMDLREQGVGGVALAGPASGPAAGGPGPRWAGRRGRAPPPRGPGDRTGRGSPARPGPPAPARRSAGGRGRPRRRGPRRGRPGPGARRTPCGSARRR